MSDGKTHSLGSLSAGIALSTTGILAITQVFTPDQIVIAGVSATTLGLLLTPDLDLDTRNISSYWARKFFFTDFFFNMVFEAYRRSYKHRSKWSHLPLLSTFVRIIYLFCPLIILVTHDQPTPTIKLLLLSLPACLFSALLCVSLDLVLQYVPIETIIHYSIGIVYGLIVSDTIHYIFDQI